MRIYVCVSVISVYIGIYVLYVHNPGGHGKFYGQDKKIKMVVLENMPWRSLNYKENDCRFVVQRKEPRIHA